MQPYLQAAEASATQAQGQNYRGACPKLNFTHTTSDSKKSRLCPLKSGILQRSVLATLFNICIYGLPSMISKKFAYADDLELLHSSENWKDIEQTLANI